MNKLINKLKGPILVTGAGGFVGVNLLKKILEVRNDVLAVSHDPLNNWRFKEAKIPKKVCKKLDLNDYKKVEKFLEKYKPKTIFHLAAYGAYSKQSDWKRIYETNLLATANLLELLKDKKIAVFITAGSSSEYGLNAKAPMEDDKLLPNSHYAVSKIGAYFLGKYYAKVFKMPVLHARLYAVYGSFEEEDRLIPRLVEEARKGKYPPLVNKQISRDFIYVDDVVEALMTMAIKIKPKDYGEAFNVGTGIKTTMSTLAKVLVKECDIKTKPKFGVMPKRAWDVVDWYGKVDKIEKRFKWKARTSLLDGLLKTLEWQNTRNKVIK